MMRKVFLAIFMFLLCCHATHAQQIEPALFPIIHNKKVGYINIKGDIIVPPVYDHGDLFQEGFASVRKGEKEGYLNVEGKEVISLQFDNAYSFSEGKAFVRQDDRLGYINTKGEWLFDRHGDCYGDKFSEGLAVITCHVLNSFDKAIEIVSESGDRVFRMENVEIMLYPWYSNGLLYVHQKDTKGEREFAGFVDRMGKEKFYSSPTTFIDGLAKDGHFGYINIENKTVISGSNFQSFGSFSEGLAVARPKKESEINPKWGFIDLSGKFVVEPEFDMALDFSEGIAAVKIGDKWGAIEKSGEIVIEPQFESLSSFTNGLAVAQKMVEYPMFEMSYINMQGNVVWKSELIDVQTVP